MSDTTAGTPAIKSGLQRFVDAFCSDWFRRICTTLALASGCAWLGLVIGELYVGIFGPDAAGEVFKTVSYGALVFALWKIVAENWLAIWKFIKSDQREGIYKPLVQLALTVAGFGLVAGSSGASASERATLVVASSFVLGDARHVDNTRVMLPYFSGKPERRKAEHPGDGTEEFCRSNLEALAKVDDERTVLRLACGLRACSSAKQPVVVDVQGFASSRAFQCGELGSDERNLALAEKRRQNVIALLNSPLDAETCPLGDTATQLSLGENAGSTRWRDHAEMERERDLADRVPGSADVTDATREILSRRVDVVIVDRGDCNAPEPAATTLAANTPRD